MNILILNTHNPFKESGIVALDLFNQLKKNDHEVRLLVNRYDKNYPEGIISAESLISSVWREVFIKFKRRYIKIKKLFRIKQKKQSNPNYYFSQSDEKIQIYSTDKLLKISGIKPDIIIILFAKKFINAKNIFELYTRTHARIFWLMYDMAPFTGGCHYAWDCKGYQNKCGNCPGLYSSDPFDESNKNLSYKKKFLDQVDLQIIAGSEWQYKQARESTLFKKIKICKILTSCNNDVFRPLEKKISRDKYSLPIGCKVIFFGASSLDDERKGIRYLLEALLELKKLIGDKSEMEVDVLLLIAGSNLESIRNYIPFKYNFLGLLDNTYGIASAYQAADVFVCPSIEDSGPTMINQSIMCGTPVVSFEMGVAIDLVINYKTGFRVKLKDSNALARAIFDLLYMNDQDYLEMRNNCRKLALDLYQPAVNSENWTNVLNGNL